MVLDSAVTDHVALVAQLEQLLNARVHNAIVQRLDMVNETTVVDVRYSVARRSAAAGTSKSVRAGALR
jgi:hypothetical protein